MIAASCIKSKILYILNFVPVILLSGAYSRKQWLCYRYIHQNLYKFGKLETIYTSSDIALLRDYTVIKMLSNNI